MICFECYVIFIVQIVDGRLLAKSNEECSERSAESCRLSRRDCVAFSSIPMLAFWHNLISLHYARHLATGWVACSILVELRQLGAARQYVWFRVFLPRFRLLKTHLSERNPVELKIGERIMDTPMTYWGLIFYGILHQFSPRVLACRRWKKGFLSPWHFHFWFCNDKSALAQPGRGGGGQIKKVSSGEGTLPRVRTIKRQPKTISIKKAKSKFIKFSSRLYKSYISLTRFRVLFPLSYCFLLGQTHKNSTISRTNDNFSYIKTQLKLVVTVDEAQKRGNLEEELQLPFNFCNPSTAHSSS